MEKQKSYFEWTRPEMLDFVPIEAKRILDVGCASGGFSASLKAARGAEVWGVEPDPESAARASERIDRVICGVFDERTDFGSERFDCVVFNDVLEHMTYPQIALARAKQLLSPNGVVVASIPNVRHLSVVWDLAVRGKWEYQDAGILDDTHFRFFTQSSIVGMFERSGLTVRSCVGINEAVGRKFRLLNLFFPKRMSGMRYMQYAVVADAARASEASE
jgi:2-polyprenyl-3-methyl-5-hydroxy-6-metoxy-1,4-benzoquinol methylase